MTRIAITGAQGFLGRALVKACRAAGVEVCAISRRADPMADTAITSHAIDLGAETAARDLGPILEGVDCVIHAAASFTGDTAQHARDTIGSTQNVIAAMQNLTAPPKLVLVSSFSVYDIASLTDFAVLDEQSPVITPEGAHDAYSHAKRQQELLVSDTTLPTCIVRPGAIYGPGRLWSPQLGFAKAGCVICPGGQALMPAVEVDHAATSLVAAALGADAQGIINLVDPDPPTQGAWLAALNQRTIYVSRRWVLAAGARLGRGEKWAARFKPLSYDLRRAGTVLGHSPTMSFPAAIAAAKAQEAL